ncbi:MAG: hypothetical protein ACD_29C00185G0001 [uncultured bacterium]|nr:MAG: hypothetical protein ACD_29C00185G0001 [uncultured bacterium]
MEFHSLSNNNASIGALAEIDACEFLEKCGLKLIEKNFTVINESGIKTGEIDLIMRDKQFLVFVEVKKRGREDYGDVLEMVTKHKQSQIIRTATHYLVRTYQYHNTHCRFDVVGISPDKKEPNNQKIEWIKDAFQVQY